MRKWGRSPFCGGKGANAMIDVRMDLSGLERLGKVLKRIHGSKTWEFSGIPDLSETDEEGVAEEAVQHLLTDEPAQKALLRSGSFSYQSRLAAARLTVRVPS